MAKGIKIVTDVEIVVPVEHGWTVQYERDPIRRGELMMQNANDELDKINSLRGVNARVNATTQTICSHCGLSFEIDEEYGLTACCGESVDAPEARKP